MYIVDPSFRGFLVQGLIAILPILGSYIAYRFVRVPERTKTVKDALYQLGYDTHYQRHGDVSYQYTIWHYLWPLTLACSVILILYSMTHPYVINSGLWVGTLEEILDIFGLSETDVPRAIQAGRILFWGWLGAYIYAFGLIFRRYMAYDLTPNVYVFAASRFVQAWIIGSIVAVASGTFFHSAGMGAEANMATIFVLVFFIGFFPEQGMDWITAFSKRRMGQRSGVVKETRLADIEGLSIWHQGRLQQEGIDNVQNLATVDIPSLLINTPFTIGQIIDWVDQAILLVYANGTEPKGHMYRQLENVGVRCASDFLTAADDEARLKLLVQALKETRRADESTSLALTEARLQMLLLSVQSATNVKITARFRWQSSMNAELVEAARKLQPFKVLATTEMSRVEVPPEFQPQLTTN
jgi:hypothetical protein